MTQSDGEIFSQKSLLTVVLLGLANNVIVDVSSGKCPYEPCSTNGWAMEKDLFLVSVGDTGCCGASKSYICVLKPPATFKWLTPTDSVQQLKKNTEKYL